VRTRSSSKARRGPRTGRTRPRGPAAIFLDYDGTLVRIARSPEEAVLSPEVRDLLARLGRAYFVAIVSGRSLSEIRRLVGLRSLAFAGNHGLELRARGRTWVHPEARRARPALRSALAEIRGRTRRVPGILVEDKGLTASVHLRRVSPERRAAVRAAVADALRLRPTLRLAKGKSILELRPRIEWDKGRAILKLLAMARLPEDVCPVYFGDDKTDEDAFRALEGRGLTVRVGRPAATAAALRLPGVPAVGAALRAILALAEKSPGVARGAGRAAGQPRLMTKTK